MTDVEKRTAIELGVLLHRVYTAASQRLTGNLEPLGLTTRHASVMFMIRDGVRTQRDLVARLAIDKTAMVRTVDDLVRLGHLVRIVSAEDRRVTILELTDGGTRALAEVQQQTSIVAGELFDAVAPEEIEVLASVLTRLDARLGRPL
ncbi:DNA-binding MarR family transcriptional regulator [Microbacterium sp. 8M]|uniref:MarR family winged helix-turn-helix transcriptional regulator n=1 Tax=Microbacterium sp. 8M TaxID=2653153 RepID=UPI0012F0C245|nr:MarR family transcriptional regulator [Microbacterium sp. 8M]VXC21686.1 DNA-binding MarR family transcriptional regulator [Microbacterium sp. 8M]